MFCACVCGKERGEGALREKALRWVKGTEIPVTEECGQRKKEGAGVLNLES